ncbi:MAG: ABC transporter permease [Candidatus Kerfeldbacteria bacterium CG15_BIG_FIL_POST_REV_8_21_14_020_45_12]|uniref:Transport permease protein n=1 Tax=Candidatus Kerfeldbacteria bacterium CG15_BIG_FIL_POST_REV_8_21_14_020_45_12 TaxID=2014247 RepID=A0A2M7H4W3_9BACT|nr:MAG: ABC transporter permease [Candidatus Kerfeldbacteria bacterium CG15_BIG_FIL_POST_REV_8_21_14_020_45_12]PJA93160.1 MAG: ABC transporter permease [Candidatus Kerfeldbacteria bacterium CG_4_9_14_3_um_filter_45_8]
MTINKQLVALSTIARKEITRFLRIWTQTLIPPVITQTLYFVVFGSFIGSQVGDINGISYIQFIVPGLVMMAVISSSYMNTVSSFFIAKFQRNIEELLVSPSPGWVVIAGYTAGGVARGLLTGAIVFVVSLLFTHPTIQHPLLILVFVILTSVVFSLAGLLNGIFAKKFDDTSIFTTFILTPLTYLGGVFYAIDRLPPIWQTISKFNPIVYMIDGFRYGFYGFSSVSVWVSLLLLSAFSVALILVNLFVMKRGTGLKS